MAAITLHLMTQRGQPYGSTRKCCERCGLMMVARPPEFWEKHAWTDIEEEYTEVAETKDTKQYIPCDSPKVSEGAPV